MTTKAAVVAGRKTDTGSMAASDAVVRALTVRESFMILERRRDRVGVGRIHRHGAGC